MTDEELTAPLLPPDAVFLDDDEHARLEPLVVTLECRLLDGVATEAERAEYATLRDQFRATQRETARWAAARAFARKVAGLVLVGCSGPSSYPCDAEVLEIPAPHPPAQVVECIDDGCDPSQWWTSGDTLLVPCDGGEVLVWW